MTFFKCVTFMSLVLLTSLANDLLARTTYTTAHDVAFAGNVGFDHPEFYEHLSRLTRTHPATPTPFQADFARVSATEIVDTANRSYELWADMIDRAEDHIHIFTFFIEDDVDFNDLKPTPCPGAPQVFDRSRIMCKVWLAAERGVQVRLITDSLGNQKAGSGVGGEKIVTALTEHPNADVINFNPLLAYTGARQLLWKNHKVWLWAQNRIHVKLMVTDGRRAITGGRNIGANYMKPAPKDQTNWGPRVYSNPQDSKYRDSEVYVEGPGVAAIQKVFLRNWLEFSEWEVTISDQDRKWSVFDPRTWLAKGRCTQQVYYRIPYYCKPEDNRLAGISDIAQLMGDREFFPILAPQGSTDLLFIDSAPVRAGEIPRNPLANPEDTRSPLANRLGEALEHPTVDDYRGLSVGERLYLALIQHSQKQILLTNPYFILNEPLRRSLNQAIERGVDVKVLTNSYGSSNPTEIWQCSASDMKHFLDQGVEFYQWTSDTGMMHAKTAIFDHEMAIVGSFNFDGVSYNNNFESLAVMTGADLIDQLHKVWTIDIHHPLTKRLETTDLAQKARDIGLDADYSNAVCDNLGALL
ncbi:MAG: phospholipase D-like domain-containing protein [Oligoflexus sp.]